MRTRNNEKTGVYGIFHNDKCVYVGRGYLNDRKNYHWSRCRNQKHSNSEMQAYWNETDGENTWEFRVLEYCFKKDFQFYEAYYINEYNTIDDGFNTYNASEYHYNTNTYKKKKSRELRSELNAGENNPRCKYSREQIIELKIMFKEGYSYQEIAEKLNMSYPYVCLIANGHKWTSITDDEIQAVIDNRNKLKRKFVYLELEPLYLGFDVNINA